MSEKRRMVARKRVKLNPGNPIDFTEFYRGGEAEGKYPEWPEGLRHVAFYPRESVESLYENVFDRRFRHAYYADRRIIRQITSTANRCFRMSKSAAFGVSAGCSTPDTTRTT